VGVFESIRLASARVVERAHWVSIDDERLEGLIPSLTSDRRISSQSDPAHLRWPDARETLAFVLTLDALNFGSGWFPELRKRPGCSGYFTIAGALRDHFERSGPLDAEALSSVTARDCGRIFGQDLRSPVDELLELFARSLRDLGNFLRDGFSGSMEGLVESAGYRAAHLVESLAEMPLYRDVERYGDFDVPFYKRAQITCADLASAFRGRDFGYFQDLAEMTIFADNLVPHVLRREGALVYHPDLLERIRLGELIASGSAEEIEIRASAVHAVERLCGWMRERGLPATAGQLDQRLWQRGQSPFMKAENRHRTRCSFY
jgi:hypothetical protein